MADSLYDLYLFMVNEPNTLYKLSKLCNADARAYANAWVDMNDMHDYILVTEGSTPWMDLPVIIEKTPEWISLEYDRLHRGE